MGTKEQEYRSTYDENRSWILEPWIDRALRKILLFSLVIVSLRTIKNVQAGSSVC